MAQRIQLKRSKGWRKPENTVSATRPLPLGNPFIGPDAINAFRLWLFAERLMSCGRVVWMVKKSGGNVSLAKPKYETLDPLKFRQTIRDHAGGDFACWCKLTMPCHVDVILEFLEQDRKN